MKRNQKARKLEILYEATDRSTTSEGLRLLAKLIVRSLLKRSEKTKNQKPFEINEDIP